MPAKPRHCAKYRQDLKVRAFVAIGVQCVFCHDGQDLHCAHVGRTLLKGPGRGMQQRYSDVLKNPDKYRPMCKDCHRTFDALVASIRKEPPVEEIPF